MHTHTNARLPLCGRRALVSQQLIDHRPWLNWPRNQGSACAAPYSPRTNDKAERFIQALCRG